ncbi:MocR-like pyridoxine biosynthesis transcription factor PdxR [Achromobacter kerstersii]
MKTSRSTPALNADTSRSIYEGLKAQILDGTLRAGSFLPSTRAMAVDLVVSRTTVSAVYDQLAAEGYVETHQGRRARVAQGASVTPIAKRAVRLEMAEPRSLSAYGKRVCDFVGPGAATGPGTDPQVIDFLYGALAFDDFPILAWRKAYSRALVQRQHRLYYEAPEGEPALREALAGYLRRARGLTCHPDQIVIVHGSQQAIDLCARVLVDPKDRVLVEEPCYVMARRIFEAVGAHVQEALVDEHGLVSERLPERRSKLIYVTPSHQFPLGGVMPITRRKELLAWAERQQAWIVEDDYDGEFRYGMRPVDALQSVDDKGSVIYVGTFSKALSPQLRLGYLVLPDALVSVFREAKRLMDRHAPSLEQVALASLIVDGTYERHVRRCRRMNESRREALLRALDRHLPDSAEVMGSASGLHVVVWLLHVAKNDEAELVRLARKQGVGVRPISPLYAAGDKHRARPCAGIILGYASLTPADINEGTRRLVGAIQALG